jgi:hypothetical protein
VPTKFGRTFRDRLPTTLLSTCWIKKYQRWHTNQTRERSLVMWSLSNEDYDAAVHCMQMNSIIFVRYQIDARF